MKGFKETPVVKSHIERIRIPDEDMRGWIETLYKGGFDEQEIDRILINLNKTYARMKGPQYIEHALKQIEDDYRRAGQTLSYERREYIRQMMAFIKGVCYI